MRPQKQKFRHDPANGVWGDCHRTCVAAIFNLDRDDVPHFADGGPGDGAVNQRVTDWLKPLNLQQVHIPFDCTLEQLFASFDALNPMLHFILGGTSKNGTGHSVVCCGGAIALDPSLDDSGIVGKMDDGFFWVTFFCPIVVRQDRTT